MGLQPIPFNHSGTPPHTPNRRARRCADMYLSSSQVNAKKGQNPSPQWFRNHPYEMTSQGLVTIALPQARLYMRSHVRAQAIRWSIRGATRLPSRRPWLRPARKLDRRPAGPPDRQARPQPAGALLDLWSACSDGGLRQPGSADYAAAVYGRHRAAATQPCAETGNRRPPRPGGIIGEGCGTSGDRGAGRPTG